MSSNHYIKLNTGQKMPIIGLGTALVDEDEMRRALNCALESGYRSIDTAYFYLNEDVIGEVLHEWFSKGKLKREDVFVTTKLPAIANRPKDVNRFLVKSLQSLKLDYVDQYLIHHPFGLKYIDDVNIRSMEGLDTKTATLEALIEQDGESLLDHDTDLEAIWKAMEQEAKAGRAKSIGVSNFNSSQVQRIMKIAKIPPAVNQVEIHLYFQQHPLVEFCQKLGIAMVSYGSVGAPHTPEGETMSVLKDPTVLDIAKKHGKTPGQIALKALVQRNIIVIPKSITPRRIKSNIDIFNFHLTDEDLGRLAKLDKGKSGRIYHSNLDFKGCSKHKEYPFHAEF